MWDDMMNPQNLLERLRDQASHLRRIGYTDDAAEIEEAISEIERLRAQICRLEVQAHVG